MSSGEATRISSRTTDFNRYALPLFAIVPATVAWLGLPTLEVSSRGNYALEVGGISVFLALAAYALWANHLCLKDVFAQASGLDVRGTFRDEFVSYAHIESCEEYRFRIRVTFRRVRSGVTSSFIFIPADEHSAQLIRERVAQRALADRPPSSHHPRIR